MGNVRKWFTFAVICNNDSREQHLEGLSCSWLSSDGNLAVELRHDNGQNVCVGGLSGGILWLFACDAFHETVHTHHGSFSNPNTRPSV